MMLKMVLLPQPDGPIKLTKRPCGIASVTGASAWKTPATFFDGAVLNVMLTSSTQSFGAARMHTPADREIPQEFTKPRNYIAKVMPATTRRLCEQWPVDCGS